MLQEDLSVFFGDFSVTATWTPSTGGAQQTAPVIFDQPDVDLASGMVISRDYKITMLASGFPGINRSEVITINAVNYTVRESPRQIDDGAMLEMLVMK